VAIVSAEAAGHFRAMPGGYFFGMVAKAKAGELNLARTIWGLRGHERRAGEGGHLAGRTDARRRRADATASRPGGAGRRPRCRAALWRGRCRISFRLQFGLTCFHVP